MDVQRLLDQVKPALSPLEQVRVAYDHNLDAWSREQARRDVLDRLTAKLGRLGEDADVVDLGRAGSALAFRVLREGKRVLARTERERLELEVYIMRRYDDDAPRRALYHEAAIVAARRLARTGA